MLHAVDVGSVRPGAAAVPKFGVGPKRQELMFAQSVLLADIGVLVASFFVAYLMRTRLWWYGGMLPLREFVWVLGLIIVLWPMLARSVGLTDSQTYLWPRRMFLLTAQGARHRRPRAAQHAVHAARGRGQPVVHADVPGRQRLRLHRRARLHPPHHRLEQRRPEPVRAP